MKIFYFIIILSTLYPKTDPFDGEGLYRLLTSKIESEQIEGKYYVLGFYQGFLKAERLGLKNESLRANQSYSESEKFYNDNILVPKHIKSKRILEIVLKYLQKNPDLRGKDSPTLIFEAIYKKYN